MTDPSIRVAKSGKSCTSTNPFDYIINSDINNVIIWKEAEVSVTISASSDQKSTVSYGQTLSFVPMVLIFVELTPSSGRWYFAPFTFFQSSDPEDVYIVQDDYTNHNDTAVEASQFYITFHNATASQKTIKYHYYIFTMKV